VVGAAAVVVARVVKAGRAAAVAGGGEAVVVGVAEAKVVAAASLKAAIRLCIWRSRRWPA